MVFFLNLVKSSDFIRAMVYVGTALGITINPEHIEAIVAGGFALSGIVHAIRAGIKKDKKEGQ